MVSYRQEYLFCRFIQNLKFSLEGEHMEKKTNLLIIGEGPFGLAMAAYAQHLGIDHLVAGKPMEFWRANMPEGMYLRSGCDWHLDPLEVDTIECFLQTPSLAPADVEPLSRNFYLSYRDVVSGTETDREAYRDTSGDSTCRRWARSVSGHDGGWPNNNQPEGVVIALGFKYFKNEPRDPWSISCLRVAFRIPASWLISGA